MDLSPSQRAHFEGVKTSLLQTLKSQYYLDRPRRPRIKYIHVVIPPPMKRQRKWSEEIDEDLQRKSLDDYRCQLCKQTITDVDIDHWFYMLRASRSCPPSHGFCVQCVPQRACRADGKIICWCPAEECGKTFIFNNVEAEPINDDLWREAQAIQNAIYEAKQRKKAEDKEKAELKAAEDKKKAKLKAAEDRKQAKEDKERAIWKRGGEKRCRICLAEYPNRYQKRRHMRVFHGIGDCIKCVDCQQTFSDPRRLETHRKGGVCGALVRKLGYSCMQCGKKFTRKRQVRLHLPICKETCTSF